MSDIKQKKCVDAKKEVDGYCVKRSRYSGYILSKNILLASHKKVS